MALANVAFLAAQNGHRVLVMDWDLEAPGLPYYFRGLMEGADLKQLKEAPGILDLIWTWRSTLSGAKSQRQSDQMFEWLASGEPYRHFVRNVVAWEDDGTGVLDYIGAGSPVVDTPTPLPYEEALARFSWTDFFDNYSGGSLLQGLRDWAKRNYDFVFIDSRTGMADVSGICTMQMPDTVALCFVLNRQNIDGVAKVAAAIRAKREDVIELRAMPMRLRTAGVGASLETDAQARAQLQLTKIGGFSTDALQDDFRLLSVNTAHELPYYETLAPLLADDPSLDYLTLNYLRLANQLLDTNLEIPDYDEDWMEAVRRRLQPTHATIDYVEKLKTSEPSRAVDELSRLIESAFEDEIDGAELDDDYVSALVETAIGLTDYSDSPFESVAMLNRAIDLLRDLTAQHPEKWKALLVSALERCLSDLPAYLEPAEELALLEELDGLLSAGTAVPIKMRRILNRRRAARLYANENEFESANQTLGDLSKLIRDMREAGTSLKLSAEQMEELAAADVETSVIKGDIFHAQGNYPKSVKEYRSGIDKLLTNPSGGSGLRMDLLRLRYDLHSRLARADHESVTAAEAAEHALQAVRAVSWSGGVNALVAHFVDLSYAILRVNDRDTTFRFLDAAFGDERRGHLQFANYHGRHPRVAVSFLAVLARLAEQIAPINNNRSQSLLRQMTTVAVFINANLDRRRHTINDRSRAEVREHLDELLAIVGSAGITVELPSPPRPRRPKAE